jgi:very-short-patch-repair endonuclease
MGKKLQSQPRISREELEILLNQKITIDKIGEIFGVVNRTIHEWMKYYGLRAIINRTDHITKKQIKELVDKRLCTREIGKILGIAKCTANKLVKKFGLETNPPKGNDVTSAQVQALIDKNCTYNQLYRQLKISPQKLDKILQENNLEIKAVGRYDDLKWAIRDDWDKMSKEYKEGAAFADISIKYKIDKVRLRKAQKMGLFYILTPKEMDARHNVFGKAGISYPEKFFRKQLENTDFLRHYRIGRYEIDLYDPNKKLALEIDGEQHYSQEKRVRHDIKRNNFLNSKGVTVIHVRWNKFVKLSEDEKYLLIYYIVHEHEKIINNECVKVFYPENAKPVPQDLLEVRAA